MQMKIYPQIKNVKILLGSTITLHFYEHLQLQLCQAIITKSENNRKHQIIFVHCFNNSHVFKECDFNNIIKMNIFTTAKKKKVPLQQNEKQNCVFTFSSAENVMEIEALLRHAFVSVE